MTSLLTERLLLRPFRDTDLDGYADMCADPEVMRYLGLGQPLTRAEAWRNMATVVGHWYLRGFGMWAVEERASGLFVGRVGLWYPEGWPHIELGWSLCRGAWGRGYATEAAEASLRHAFLTLSLPHIISLIRPDNVRSIRVAERLGETLADQITHNDHPTLVYRITADEWHARCVETRPG